MSEKYTLKPKYVVLNTLSEDPEWHVFENLCELNDFITRMSHEDWDYTNTYKIFQVDVVGVFKAAVQVDYKEVK